MYVQQSDLTGMLPPDFLTQALDDTGDGSQVAATFAQIATDIGTAIDGYLGVRFALPLAEPYPAVVTNAAKVFLCEQLYLRRGLAGSKNPYATQADGLRAILKSISLGETPLSPEINRQDPSASVVTEPMGSASRRRHGRRTNSS
jgi:phage gp36-like protein